MIYFRPMVTKEDWEWVRTRARPIACEDSQGIVAFNEKGETQAICVADSFTVASCCVHFAIENPMVIKYGFFHEIARHYFNACGRTSLIGLVPDNNAAALKLDKHIGFVEVGRVPNGYDEGVDTVILQLTRETGARWLTEEVEHGRKVA